MIKINIKFIISTLIFFSFATVTQAATQISLNSTTHNVSVGDSLSVDMQISASVDAINIVDGVITYDPNVLEVEKVMEDSSIVSLWAKPITFDNKSGQINFIGGIKNGYLGQNGEIAGFVFKVKDNSVAAGSTTTIDFKDSFAVYKNDGKGTKINPWLRPLQISILPASGISSGNNPGLTSKVSSVIVVVISLLVLIVLIFILKKYAKHK